MNSARGYFAYRLLRDHFGELPSWVYVVMLLVCLVWVMWQFIAILTKHQGCKDAPRRSLSSDVTTDLQEESKDDRIWPGCIVSLVVVVGLVVGILVMVRNRPSDPGPAVPDPGPAVSALKHAGVEITRDEKLPGNPVVRVDIEGPLFRGSSFSTVVRHLKRLPHLRYLRISSMAMISASDLRHLEGLTQLETIELYGTGMKSSIERLRGKLPHVRIDYYDSVEQAMERIRLHGLR